MVGRERQRERRRRGRPQGGHAGAVSRRRAARRAGRAGEQHLLSRTQRSADQPTSCPIRIRERGSSADRLTGDRPALIRGVRPTVLRRHADWPHNRNRVGLNGAGGWTTPDPASTAGANAVSDEARSAGRASPAAGGVRGGPVGSSRHALEHRHRSPSASRHHGLSEIFRTTPRHLAGSACRGDAENDWNQCRARAVAVVQVQA
jgi:hypothetical protein